MLAYYPNVFHTLTIITALYILRTDQEPTF